MTDAVSVTVVIPVLDPGPMLSECIASLGRREDLEIIVVDNASTDGSVEEAAATDPALRVLRNEKNKGFASACNSGAQIAVGRYLLLLNSDATLPTDGVQRLLAAAEGDHQAAIWQPVILDPSGGVENAGEFFTWSGFFIRGRCLPTPDGPTYPVFAGTAACLLLRRDVFLSLGGFNDGYFAYVEDVDLCWRARLAGWEVKVVPSVRVCHAKNVTSRRIFASQDFRHLTFRNRWRMILANAALPTLIRIVPLYLLASVSTAIVLLLSGRWRSAIAVTRAVLWPVGHRSEVRADRCRVAAVRIRSDRQVLRADLTKRFLTREGWELFADHHRSP